MNCYAIGISIRTFVNYRLYVSSLFFITQSNIANYEDDTTVYECEENVIEVQIKTETESLKVFEEFPNNQLQSNSTKSHVA